VATRLAWLVVGSADAEDVAQDAFVKAFYALDRFRPGAPFRPWLLRIVGNEARSRVRARGRQERAVARLALVRGTEAASPEDSAIALDRRRRLVNALNDLPERDRIVLACRYLAEMSEAETAAALDCALGTVKSRTARALARLGATFGEDELVMRDE
jgi:RNA polymerase sigma-70 factor (ECF subfamily)